MREKHIRIKVDLREGIPSYETPMLDQWVEDVGRVYALVRAVIRKEYWTNLKAELDLDPSVVTYQEIGPEKPMYHLRWAEKVDGKLTGLRSPFQVDETWISVAKLSDQEFRRKVAGQEMPLLRRIFMR